MGTVLFFWCAVRYTAAKTIVAIIAKAITEIIKYKLTCRPKTFNAAACGGPVGEIECSRSILIITNAPKTTAVLA